MSGLWIRKYNKIPVLIYSYLDVLERSEMFCERCILENNVYSQYGEILTEMEEQSERFVPG